jgi:putative acetyltransferase
VPGHPALPAGLRIRPETPADFAAVDRLQLAAFEDPQIPPLIAAIRADPGYVPELALVAEVQAPGVPAVVGHILVSRTDLLSDAGGHTAVLMLSPLGVDPGWQGRGIGSALVRAALETADARPEPVMIVQGHPDYYPRFGFVRGRTLGILPPEHLGAIDTAWMARPAPSWTPEVRGRVVYPRHFVDLD